MNIYISNLNTSITDEELTNLFRPYGEVAAATVAMDAFTDQSRGFGFVDMPQEEQARTAITALNQTEVNGLVVSVEEAAPKEERKGSYKVGSGPIHFRTVRSRR